MRVEVLDEAADNWAALFWFLIFGLFMAILMVPQFRFIWPQAQLFSFFSGITWISSYLLYQIVLILFVILVDLVAAFCFLRILRRIRRPQRESAL